MTDAESLPPISIIARINPCVNYACFQNAVPIIRSLHIRNNGTVTVQNLKLEFRVVPAFAGGRVWTIDRIEPEEETELFDRLIELDPAYLSGLNEAERGRVELLLTSDGVILSKESIDIRILARDEWGGFSSGPELLAAFVMPNDPAITRIMKKAGEVLSKSGHSSALDGYQSRDMKRCYLFAAAVWSTIAAEKLTYANPPRSFEASGQKTRRPSVILQEGLATCLDSTLLFASVLESIGLNTVAIFLQGHCFVGVWLRETTFRNLVETDVTEIRKAIAAKEFIVFETTLITHNPPAKFPDACRAAEASLSREKEAQFVAAVDFTRARMAQIRPLASHETTSEAAQVAGEQTEGYDLPLPGAPDLPDYRNIEEPDDRPTTPAGRIERWQRKLLDLTLRNRLLNFRDTKQSVPFLCPDVPQLEDQLASGTKLRIVSLADQNPIGDRDESLHQRVTQRELNTEFARQALQRSEITSSLTRKDLDARLIELYRKSKNDLAEGGSNTLYLAVGFLSWKKQGQTDKTFRAPLILVPVKLVRASAASPFHLTNHEDEARFNATLIQMLRKDFDCDLSSLESGLPVDHSGVDVGEIFSQVRRGVRDIPGFEVIDETALSTFSFAKYLMWKDLTDRRDELVKNRVVQHLIENPEKPFDRPVPTPFPRCQDIDRKYIPGQLIHPLPADSSQLAALAAVDAGHDFVLIGPPGTGKSQTIANMIAHCLAKKKTVLFVAEKTAALGVVYRRLKERGLGDYCLELHSNKADRKHLLNQLMNVWKTTDESTGNEWLKISEKLRIRRDELNNYVSALHEQHQNGWTVFRAMGVSVKGVDRRTPEFNWPKSVKHDADRYAQLAKAIDELSLTRREVGEIQKPTFFNIQEWSAVWQENLFAEAEKLSKAARELRRSLKMFAEVIGVPDVSDGSNDELQLYAKVARELNSTAADNFGIIFHKQFSQMAAQADALEQSLTVVQSETARLSAIYPDDVILNIPVDDLDREWRVAATRIWPLSLFAKRRVRKMLQSYASSGSSAPGSELAALKKLQTELRLIDQSPLAGQEACWNGRNTDPNRMKEYLSRAKELRQSIVDLGKQTNQLSSLSAKLHPILSRDSTSHPVVAAARLYLQDMTTLAESVKQFKQLCGGSPIPKGTQRLISDVESQVQLLLEGKASLRKWISWHAVCVRANSLGLGSFVAAIEAGQLKPEDVTSAFELAYVRWWLPRAIDRSDSLRTFQRYRHEDAISDFRALDDLARKESTQTIRSATRHGLPDPNSVPRQSELGLLRHQGQLQKPSKTIRELIGGMPENFGKLAPCLLMSPLSIAQYLPANQSVFDIVIFDEASQITTWDAIGAIARGQQTIIVGDPKQLPPTNFFGRQDDDADNDEIADQEKDLESILDEAKASGIPTLQLNWHYRSSHESLIAFSNFHYYGNELITFPSAETTDRAVSLKYLPNSIYDRGNSRTNRDEAKAIVADAVGRMKHWMQLPESKRLTLGVITFNTQQQVLIQDLLDQARRDSPEIEWFFEESRIEPTIVKNLENVQGDERDVMLFSIAFGPDPTGRLPLVFGALNRNGGERRLNVAVTRARREMVVYSSFRSDQLNAERSKQLGVRHLKTFLDYAERGPVALFAQSRGSVGGFESPFEEAVSARLEARGWQTTPQVGVSAFRIDLGIVNPDKPGAYLAGIECDGATYHRSATAQDRDKIREQMLRHLGWEILRVWSTDWWAEPDAAIDRLHNALNDLLERSRNTDRSLDEQELAQQTADDSGSEEVSCTEDGATEAEFDATEGETTEIRYQLFDGSGYDIQPASFYDANYTDTLRKITLAALEAESPIRDDVLCQRIARLHQLVRTTVRIRERVLSLIPSVSFTDESSGRFLWYPGTPFETTNYRHPRTESERRPIDEISLAELTDFVITHRALMTSSDPAISISRRLGVTRLKRNTRDRIMEAIHRATEISVPFAGNES